MIASVIYGEEEFLRENGVARTLSGSEKQSNYGFYKGNSSRRAGCILPYHLNQLVDTRAWSDT